MLDGIINALQLPPVLAFFIMLFGLGIYITWKLAKIDSRINWLTNSQRENNDEHKKMNEELADIGKNVSRIQGYIFRDSEKDTK